MVSHENCKLRAVGHSLAYLSLQYEHSNDYSNAIDIAGLLQECDDAKIQSTSFFKMGKDLRIMPHGSRQLSDREQVMIISKEKL
jgi:hypothetical protein